MFRIILVLFSIIKILTYNITSFQLYSNIEGAPGYGKFMPYRFQFSSDGNIVISLPRVYENYDDATQKEYSPYPALLMLEKNNSSPKKMYSLPNIYSVMGFSLDKDNKLYILDQGIIIATTNTVIEQSPKLLVYTLNQTYSGKVNETYNFTGIDLTNSLLTDIAVEHSGAYAYIVDSGNLKNANYNPGIIVLNLQNGKVYKVLNNHSSFKPYNITNKLRTDEKIKILKYFEEAIGVNCIQISCNDDTIYYSSLKNTKIFSVSTKDIKNAIKNYENDNSKTKNDILNNIKVNSADIGFEPENFVISSKNNIFALNSEIGYIEISFSIDKDLSSYNKSLNTNITFNEDILNKVYCLNVCNGSLYVLENFLDNKSGANDDKATIYKAEIKNDELNSNVGCSVFIFKISGANIFIFVYFFLVLFVTIMIIIANSGDALVKSKAKKDQEKEANIDELNKKLNE